jgi:hypothetical protein
VIYRPDVSAQLLQTIAEPNEGSAAVRLVSKATITMLCSADKRVTRNEDDSADSVY